MKKFKIVLLLVLPLAFWNCEDDDPAPASPQPVSIVGTYDIVGFDGIYENFNQPGNLIDFRNEFSGSNFNNTTFTFTADGRLTTSGTFTITEILTSGGSTDTNTYQSDFVDFQGSYTFNGGQLILNIDGERLPFSIENETAGAFSIVTDFTINEPDFSERTRINFDLVRQ